MIIILISMMCSLKSGDKATITLLCTLNFVEDVVFIVLVQFYIKLDKYDYEMQPFILSFSNTSATLLPVFKLVTIFKDFNFR